MFVNARAGQPLAIVLVLYTAWTLAMMAQFGRDTWRAQGETFSVWFGVVNRLAPLAPVEGSAGRLLRRRPFGSGLAEAAWATAELVLLAIATAAILFDGLSQTQIWFDAFGTPAVPAATVQLIAFLGAITLLVLGVAQIVGILAMAAGLVPIALGYLIAHYLTALVFDGQRIVVAVSDPFQQGWNLFGGLGFEPAESWLPYGVVWAAELVAVVGGHILSAVMGHRVALLGGPEPVQVAAPGGRRAGGGAGRDRQERAGRVQQERAGRVAQPPAGRVAQAPAQRGVIADVRLRQVPLAALMVFLTTLTLWSLGQGLVQHTDEPASGAVQMGHLEG